MYELLNQTNMKTSILALFILLSSSLLFSQNTFKLGYTGAYPNYYNYPVTSIIDWNFYKEMNMNIWQGNTVKVKSYKVES